MYHEVWAKTRYLSGIPGDTHCLLYFWFALLNRVPKCKERDRTTVSAILHVEYLGTGPHSAELLSGLLRTNRERPTGGQKSWDAT